jgi:hypothetical protein
MAIILALLTLAFIFVGVGFAAHVLWLVAGVLFALWFAGIATEVGNRSHY